MSANLKSNPIYLRGLEPGLKAKDRLFGQAILGFLAFSVFYFLVGVIRSLLS